MTRKLPEEIDFFREEWKKLDKRYFLQFLPEETEKKKKTGRKRKKLEEIHVNNSACKQSGGKKFPDTMK